MTTPQLIENVRSWGREKGITGPNGKGTIKGQLSKTLEELLETYEWIVRSDYVSPSVWRPKVIDGIGDVLVTIILLRELDGSPLSNKSFDWESETSGGEPLKIIEMAVCDCSCNTSSIGILQASNNVIAHMAHLSAIYVVTMHECLLAAWKEIESRTGKMVDGVFVKD